jgi:iron complex outermembrane receptor protein
VVTFDGIIEEEEVGQVALELSYIGRQALAEDPYRRVSRPYLVLGFLAMKRVGSRATVFLNAENLLDVRLSDYPAAGAAGAGSGGAVDG